jgi:hypothetical protein
VDVGDDLRRCAFDAPPTNEYVFEEFQIFRRVDRSDRRQAEIARADDLATGGAGAGKKPLDTLRLFRIGLRRAAGQKSFTVDLQSSAGSRILLGLLYASPESPGTNQASGRSPSLV